MTSSQPSLEALATVLKRLDVKADPFALLGVTATAQQREIETAHRDLCVLLHPDRAIFRANSEHAADLTRASQAVSQAFAQIGRPEKRAHYTETQLRANQAGGGAVNTASRLRGIRALLSKRDFAAAEKAIHELRAAAPDAPRSEIELLLGQAVYGNLAHPLESRTRAATSLWSRVIDREPTGESRAEAAYLLAHLCRHDGDPNDAALWLRLCLASNPNHVAAKRLARLLERSAPPTQPTDENSSTFGEIARKSGVFIRRMLDR